MSHDSALDIGTFYKYWVGLKYAVHNSMYDTGVFMHSTGVFHACYMHIACTHNAAICMYNACSLHVICAPVDLPE